MGETLEDFRLLRQGGQGWKDGNLSLHKQRGCHIFVEIQGKARMADVRGISRFRERRWEMQGRLDN